jgi:hypothetical protein
LNLSRNFEKRTKIRPSAIQALIAFFQAEECTIEHLIIEGGKAAGLGTDIVPFIFSLMTNHSITFLNIQGSPNSHPHPIHSFCCSC